MTDRFQVWSPLTVRLSATGISIRMDDEDTEHRKGSTPFDVTPKPNGMISV